MQELCDNQCQRVHQGRVPHPPQVLPDPVRGHRGGLFPHHAAVRAVQAGARPQGQAEEQTQQTGSQETAHPQVEEGLRGVRRLGELCHMSGRLRR